MFLIDESEVNFRDLVDALKRGPVTAIIGAGLSASLQPTWTALHAAMQQAAGLHPSRTFDAAFAPADFADFRNALSTDRYLEILRNQFGGVVTEYPDLYRIIDETNGFEQLVTTNYDEFLATVAASNYRRPRITIYPHLEDFGARYVYLHGRAETAESPGDLVLCEDDYAQAYEAPGHAKHVLQVMFNRPGMFVGSSLTDPDLLTLLRERARLTSRMEPDAVPPLFAIISVKSVPDSKDDFASAADVMTRRLHWFGVRAICYAADATHSQLRSVLLQLQHEAEQRPVEAVFLERTRQLNKLGQLTAPTAADIEKVRNLIRGVPELARHFFAHSADSSAWYDGLKESVIVPGVIEPRELRDGTRQIAPWAARPFIIRIAPERPDAVVELTQRLRLTANWHVQAILGRLAAQLPADYLEQTITTLSSWMDGPNGDLNHVSTSLVPVPSRLLQAGFSSLAFDVTAELLRPMAGTGLRRHLLRVSDHHLDELRSTLTRLAEDRSEDTYRLLKDRLLEALRDNRGDNPTSSLWRAAIEEHEQNLKIVDEPLHFLLAETRDALLSWMDGAPAEAVQELDDLLSTENHLLTRLVFHVLTLHPEQLSEVHQQVVTEARFHEFELYHELAMLLHKRFGSLDDASMLLVHALIEQGPPRLAGDTDERWLEYRDHYRWQWLAVIPREHWVENERVWWEELQAFHEPPKHPFFHLWHGPIEGSLIETKTVDEQVLRRAWESGGAPALYNALHATTKPWGPLVSMILEDPGAFLQLAPLLGPENGQNLETYFRAYEHVVESKDTGPALDWVPLIDLMERFDSEELAQAPWVSGQMASLIDSGVTSEYHAIPDNLLDRAICVVACIVATLAHPIDGNPTPEGRIGLHDQLNEPAGKAADALLRCIWRKVHLAHDNDQPIPEEYHQWIADALDHGWGGLEMRHAIGEFWFVLEWAEKGWLRRHADSIWSSSADGSTSNARRAFLLGYLQSWQWSRAALEALRPMFADAIHDLSRQDPLYLEDRRLTMPFVRELVRGWLYDVDGYDFPGVIGSFVSTAPDPIRAEFVRQLGRQYRMNAEDDELDTVTTDTKRKEYWSLRVEALGASLPVSQPSEELGAFLGWLTTSSESLRTLESRLAVSIDHLHPYHGVDELLAFIAIRGAQEPLHGLRLLLRLAERLFTNYQLELWGHAQELGAAIDAICEGARKSHRPLVRQLANLLTRAGLVELSGKLANCAT